MVVPGSLEPAGGPGPWGWVSPTARREAAVTSGPWGFVLGFVLYSSGSWDAAIGGKHV